MTNAGADPSRPGDDRRRATPARRQWVVDALCEAYAQDQLGLQELERRLDQANRLRSEPELRALVADLTLSSGAGPVAAVGDGPRPAASARPTVPEARDEHSLSRVDPALVFDRQFCVGFWSGRVRKGGWVPARRITALAVMGGVKLDFREAVFGSEVVDVTALAVMGGVEIIVPPGVHVETDGSAVMGGLEDRTEYSTDQHPSAPTLRIKGAAVMGGIEIDVRLPGESAREARGRRKKAQRWKRRLARGE